MFKLSVPEIKQIAGRAGRYRTAAQAKEKSSTSKEDDHNIGIVTSLEVIDLPYIREAMKQEPAPLTAAGILPPDAVFQKFAAYFPANTPFEYIILRLLEISQVHPLFFMCDPRSQVENARLIDTVDGLRIEDRITLMAAPMYLRDEGLWDNAAAFARCVAEYSDGRLLDIPELNLEVLEMPVSGQKEYLHSLEGLHKSVILYSWLSFRFGGTFTDRTLASHVKELVETRMMRALTEFSANKKLTRNSSVQRQNLLRSYHEQQLRELQDSLIQQSGQEESLADAVTGEDGNEESTEREAAVVWGELGRM